MAFVGLVLGVLAMLPARQNITKANFDRIELGMPYWNAIELLLGEPGDQTKEPNGISAPSHIEPKEANKTGEFNVVLYHPRPGRRVWIGDKGVIILYFDNRDNVVSKAFCYVHPMQPSLFQRLRDAIGI